jgi:invasion protein IalB
MTMRKLVAVLLTTAATFAALAVPAFASNGNTFATMNNSGLSRHHGSVSVNCAASAANFNGWHGGVSVACD